MADLMEQMYSSQQIIIPPNLPTILKKFAKAAIRTQPKDLLVWAASYFKALTYGIPLPIKERLEYPPVNTISGLSPGYLKVLLNQLGSDISKIRREDIIDYWEGVCLSREALEEIFDVGGFGKEVNWLKFIAICAGYLEPSLTRTMILLCQLLTDEPAGGSAHIPVKKFIYLYRYLARLDCGPGGPKEPIEYPTSLAAKGFSYVGGETMIGEGIVYKEEDEDSECISEISWESVLKRMGKKKSQISVATVDPDKECLEQDYLGRGITWNRISEIEESEPDTSKTRSFSDPSGDSDLGLEVFEVHDDTLEKITTIQEQWKTDEPVVEVSASQLDLTEDLGTKSLDQMLEYLEEFETTQNMMAAERAEREKEDDETIMSSIKPIKTFPKTSTPPHEAHRLDTISRKDEDDLEINVLLKPDSSTILVPTPPRVDDFDFTPNDILEIEDQQDSSEEVVGQRKAYSLLDVRIPEMEIPTLLKMEDKIVPMSYIKKPKWVHIPGIGPRVPELMISEVDYYMRECAEQQAGAVMPRNIRHFLCPPLEPE